MSNDPGGVPRSRRRPAVGARVRQLRTERRLTLTQVAQQTGLNVGYLSQVETDKASPSLETLAAIADAFDVPITWLLVDDAPPPHLVRKADRPVRSISDRAQLEVVDGGFARQLRIVEISGPPGHRTMLKTDTGEEHHLVLEGHIRLRQGPFEAVLGPGDYLVWDGGFPHEAEMVGNEPARILIITPGPAGAGMVGN
jgi:transcriptional regulator with XRE-family HTH domain